tara:strand:+ start:713 stop:982 length:270 start_codon:yes stop_codon:yes gene_type:complete
MSSPLASRFRGSVQFQFQVVAQLAHPHSLQRRLDLLQRVRQWDVDSGSLLKPSALPIVCTTRSVPTVRASFNPEMMSVFESRLAAPLPL